MSRCVSDKGCCLFRCDGVALSGVGLGVGKGRRKKEEGEGGGRKEEGRRKEEEEEGGGSKEEGGRGGEWREEGGRGEEKRENERGKARQKWVRGRKTNCEENRSAGGGEELARRRGGRAAERLPQPHTPGPRRSGRAIDRYGWEFCLYGHRQQERKA